MLTQKIQRINFDLFYTHDISPLLDYATWVRSLQTSLYHLKYHQFLMSFLRLYIENLFCK